jgi:hypothetical protein
MINGSNQNVKHKIYANVTVEDVDSDDDFDYDSLDEEKTKRRRCNYG